MVNGCLCLPVDLLVFNANDFKSKKMRSSLFSGMTCRCSVSDVPSRLSGEVVTPVDSASLFKPKGRRQDNDHIGKKPSGMTQISRMCRGKEGKGVMS